MLSVYPLKSVEFKKSHTWKLLEHISYQVKNLVWLLKDQLTNLMEKIGTFSTGQMMKDGGLGDLNG